MRANARGLGARWCGLIGVGLGLLAGPAAPAGGQDLPPAIRPLVRQYCLDCHSDDVAEAQLNLEQMITAADLADRFKSWERVIEVLRARRMPPEDAPQPSASQRSQLGEAVEQALKRYIDTHAGDPGRVVMRRLTSAEYAWTIQDLTGLDLDIAQGFVSDAVGAEGFTNVGAAQFMQDSTLERYLEAAKIVSAHAVIGAGPLEFFADPGETGRELSAMARIQQIYRQHGFRTAAGEGAEPFGLDSYPRALLVAWQYRFRDALGHREVSLPELARRERLSERFADHVWSVLNRKDAPFPLSLIISRWRSLPPPAAQPLEKTRADCEALYALLRQWQSTLAAAAGDEEEAAVLTAGRVHVTPRHAFRTDIRWPAAAEVAEFEVSVSRASHEPAAGAVVIWRNPRLRFLRVDRRREPDRPLGSLVTPETARRLKFGRHPHHARIGENDFVLRGETTSAIRVQLPAGMWSAQLLVDVELDLEQGASSIVRCRISDGEVEGETAAEVGAASTLLADPRSPLIARWQEGVAEFARLLPEVSHREPAPSDRDPIPEPFDNTYNQPERNHFHYAIKYHRDDAFFVQQMADDATRRRLDQAWTDLLTSFDYHDAWLRFLIEKYALELEVQRVAGLEPATIERLPAEARQHVQRLQREFVAMQQALRAAEPRHLQDALDFAARAWRRPLSAAEQERLRHFYARLRRDHELDHVRALRSLITRILVAPAFLYRVEPPSEAGAIVPLSEWQLASRLSFLVWSSGPDEELRRLAATGRLQQPHQLARQARRMLRDPKARRLATEFFGQWLGFYRFDQYRGVDTSRFPEFTDQLKKALHEEAVQFFEHIVREDRPVDEILFADYTFLNRQLARHYGIPFDELPPQGFVRVEGLRPYHRGGLLGLGAALTATSAPLRTSAVKRGDWVLRRVVGTPVPAPPADAGSIPADDVLADGLTVRQRLEAHRSDASCVNCHSRIDPLGFALEHYDTIGRWREAYRDGQPIDPAGTLRDGTVISGPDDLRDYLRREQDNFHRTLCAKLLGYALGRAEMASDRPLIERMMSDITEDGRFSSLIVRIVTSRQFRNQRAR